MLEPSGTQASAVEKARAFRAQNQVGQNSQSHAGTADQTNNMAKIVRVRQEIEVCKPRLEEILTQATTICNTRFPTDNVEETCDNAQDTLDILRHRTQKFSDAFHEFQTLADTVGEDDGLFQKTQGAMRKQLLDAEELALRLDKKIKKYLKDSLEKQQKQNQALAGELERKQADMEAEKARTQLEMEKQRQQAQIDQEKFERESQRQKIDFEQQMKLLEAKRQADTDTFQRDMELRRMENQRVLDEQRLRMEANHQANNHATPAEHQERDAFEQNIRLPKLSLPKFSGSVLQWKGFWDSFQAAVHNKPSVSPINKFNYLKANLEGQALMVVSGLELSKENYEVAVQMLKTPFEGTNSILEAHYSQLQKLSSMSNQFNSSICAPSSTHSS